VVIRLQKKKSAEKRRKCTSKSKPVRGARVIAISQRGVTVGGGAMVHPRRRGPVIGLQKRRLAKKKERENIPVY